MKTSPNVLNVLFLLLTLTGCLTLHVGQSQQSNYQIVELVKFTVDLPTDVAEEFKIESVLMSFEFLNRSTNAIKLSDVAVDHIAQSMDLVDGDGFQWSLNHRPVVISDYRFSENQRSIPLLRPGKRSVITMRIPITGLLFENKFFDGRSPMSIERRPGKGSDWWFVVETTVHPQPDDDAVIVVGRGPAILR